PTLTAHNSLLTTQNVLLSKLTTHRSQLATENCIYSLQNSEFATDNQKGALSLGRSERNRYFCIKQTNLI
ncbi:MAG: hypothetical protein UHS32_11865, partial [Bacteroidaceae bacterium]|nr:hypothetical protein [Bacteroidaceae bacterium]